MEMVVSSGLAVINRQIVLLLDVVVHVGEVVLDHVVRGSIGDRSKPERSKKLGRFSSHD